MQHLGTWDQGRRHRLAREGPPRPAHLARFSQIPAPWRLHPQLEGMQHGSRGKLAAVLAASAQTSVALWCAKVESARVEGHIPATQRLVKACSTDILLAGGAGGRPSSQVRFLGRMSAHLCRNIG